MDIQIQTNKKGSTVAVPLTLSQFATGLRQMSQQELETLEMMLDQGALDTIQASQKDEKAGDLREL